MMQELGTRTFLAYRRSRRKLPVLPLFLSCDRWTPLNPAWAPSVSTIRRDCGIARFRTDFATHEETLRPVKLPLQAM
jgi:hypothetical protein